MTVMTRNGYFFEDLEIGMEATYAREVVESDINTFAEVSGDKNPMHLDHDYAAATMFKERIAHGILTASYISTVLGMELPGPGCIYVSQTLNFRAPVMIGDVVIARARVEELFAEKQRVVLACDCSVDGKLVLEGEAVMLVPSRAAQAR